MFDSIKPLLESGLINDETRVAISEAWESKLAEARETIRAELREEMASRYNHDKQLMVEALDKMVTESIKAEIEEFAAEKKAINEDRVKFNNHMIESAGRFDKFLVKKLAEEMQELRVDRDSQLQNFKKLEEFVVKALASEIREFAQDKKQVVETKVRLVAEAKAKLDEIKAQFIKKSAALVKESVANNLKSELTQLKEDIHVARENMFGRRLFEAFASEFSVTLLNENGEIRKLQESIKKQDRVIKAFENKLNKQVRLTESKEKEIRIIKETADRRNIMADLLKPLNKEKGSVMAELLENVQTSKLKSAYEKYLPAVLNSGASASKEVKTVLSESKKEVTGDKSAKTTVESIDSNVIEIKRLAGLK